MIIHFYFKFTKGVCNGTEENNELYTIKRDEQTASRYIKVYIIISHRCFISICQSNNNGTASTF